MKALSLLSCLLSGLALAVVLLQEQPEPVLIESQLVQERVIELPEDGGRWSTIVVYPDGAKDVESRSVASWFATEPRLQSLKAQTKYFELPASHWWPRSYAANVPAPCVILLDEQHKTIYSAYRGAMPGDGGSLADDIQARIADCCPELPSDTGPQPDPPRQWQARRKIPRIGPQSPAGEDLRGLAVLAAIGGAAFYGWRTREA